MLEATKDIYHVEVAAPRSNSAESADFYDAHDKDHAGAVASDDVVHDVEVDRGPEPIDGREVVTPPTTSVFAACVTAPEGDSGSDDSGNNPGCALTTFD